LECRIQSRALREFGANLSVEGRLFHMRDEPLNNIAKFEADSQRHSRRMQFDIAVSDLLLF
jgi:hypothetical protein